ncbi:MAG: HNH endonuclease [Treponema sp.]|jgi:predicted restriction endonuclease|nr:HNH endonuclease [Treponema sp.]
MERKEYFYILLEEFYKWYEKNHGKFEDYYSEKITKENIESLSKDEFIDFFYDFTRDGGKIQSGGQRTVNEFKRNSLIKKYVEFREYILEPFSETFGIENWLFSKRSQFRGWGLGIASIYLNRVNKNKYSIINNKTIDSLKALGYNISETINSWKNYCLIHEIQTGLINEYDILNNYFIVDAINEFIIGKPKFKDELQKLKKNELIDLDIAQIHSQNISNTEKEQLVLARKGQGLFRKRVVEIDKKCKVTDIDFIEILIASHIKPWKESSNEERLNGNNGILLSPHIDKIFDKYFISFSDDGKILVYNNKVKEILEKWSINEKQKYFDFSKERIHYLEYHRKKCNERNKKHTSYNEFVE